MTKEQITMNETNTGTEQQRTCETCNMTAQGGYLNCEYTCAYKVKKLKDDLVCKTQECENLEKEICNIRMDINGNIQPTVFGKSLDEIHKILTGHARYRKALEAFQDDYFKGLDTTAIAELAKKSIRLTTENRKLEQECEEYKKLLENSELCKHIISACELNFPIIEKYNKTVEEIEKIAKLTKEGYMGLYYGLDEILKIISKVKKEGK